MVKPKAGKKGGAHRGEPEGLRVSEPGFATVYQAGRNVSIRGSDKWVSGFDLKAHDLADVLEVTPKTLTRWKRKNEVLSPQQSDRVAVLESIFTLGEKVLGSREKIKEWIHQPVLYLNGGRPLDDLKTESGRRRVEEALHQIEFGMY